MADYTYAFDSAVYAVTAMGTPPPINTDVNSSGWGGSFPLSANNNSFVLLSAGKINHEQVEGVLFNYVAAASSAPVAHASDRFGLVSPGNPAHPDKKASAVISLTGNQPENYLSGSMMRLETVAGSLSTFIGVASGCALDNTGSALIAGSVFYSTTGTNRVILEDLANVMNNGYNNFEAVVAHRGHELTITQLSGGASGNSVPFVSGGAQSTPPNVIMIDKSGAGQTRTFNGGADEQGDATYIRAAANGAVGGYDGATVAVVTNTGLTVTYVLNHGGAVPPVLSGFNLATGPNMRREVLLGYR